MEGVTKNDNTIRNSVLFGQSLKKMGFTYSDVYRRLKENGINEFDDVLTASGELIEEDKEYRGERSIQCSDNGKRTQAQTDLDCDIGNIQEALFCIDNPQFMPNENATHHGVTSDSDVSATELDLIHIKTNKQVEFKTNYSNTVYGHNLYYRHRNGHFREFLENGGLMILNFINLGKAAVISKRNLGKSVKIKEEGKFDKLTNKRWDVITIWDGILMDYRMMIEGNHEISDKISKL